MFYQKVMQAEQFTGDMRHAFSKSSRDLKKVMGVEMYAVNSTVMTIQDRKTLNSFVFCHYNKVTLLE